MTQEEKDEIIHITKLCFTVPTAIRRCDERRTYQADECYSAKVEVLRILEQIEVDDK